MHVASAITQTPEARWQAVVARDQRIDARFVYAVRSTGIYCRPGCASRLPKRSNALFFDGPNQAEIAGFRACQRCSPNRPPEQVPAIAKLVTACRFMEGSSAPPPLADIAQQAGLSPSHLHRLFRSHLGVTPKEYSLALRAERLRQELRADLPTTVAIYAAGYESTGRCYTSASAVLGMTPGQYRGGGHKIRIRYTTVACSLGRLLVALTDKGVCHMALGDKDAQLARELYSTFPNAIAVVLDPALTRRLKRLIACAEKQIDLSAFPRDIRGTAFRQAVWKALQAIPANQVEG